MSKKILKLILVIAILGNPVGTTVCVASSLDWSNVTLSGSYPDFSFSHPTLGNVSLSYSNDAEIFGIENRFAGIDTLNLGNTGGESLTMSFSNPAVNMNMQLWDIDAVPPTNGEALTFVTAATVSLVNLHPTDVWDPDTLTLSSDGSANPNTQVNNFSVINFSDSAGFTSITFNWEISGRFSGIFGIGELSAIQAVPLPPAIYLLGSGIAALFFLKKRRA
jgi:hypothetical protein